MNKKKEQKKRKPKPTADAHSFVSRWNPRAPFGLVVLYVNPQSLTTHIHSVCIIPPTISMLPGKTFLDMEPVVRCIPVYPRPTSRRISI